MDQKQRRKVNFKMKPAKKFKPNHASNSVSYKKDTPSQDKPGNQQRIGSYKKAYNEYENIKAKRKLEKEAALKKQAEIKAALDKYKRKKTLKFKKLSAKTSKGQPIMKNRIEMLLEKIQQTAS